MSKVHHVHHAAHHPIHHAAHHPKQGPWNSPPPPGSKGWRYAGSIGGLNLGISNMNGRTHVGGAILGGLLGDIFGRGSFHFGTFNGAQPLAQVHSLGSQVNAYKNGQP
ncbi:MAG: hypothetical protein ACYCW6_16965 [Candidatus Xenobia bacterium]